MDFEVVSFGSFICIFYFAFIIMYTKELSFQRLESIPAKVFEEWYLEKLVIGDAYESDDSFKLDQEYHDGDWRLANKLKTLSPKISMLKNLKHLDLRGNRLGKAKIEDLPKLEYLNLERNYLSEIQLLELPKLDFLNLHENRFSEIEISNLPSLKTLRLSKNRLRSCEIHDLPELTDLYLDFNQLTSIKLYNLPKLKTLNLDCNKLTHLQPQNLPSLENLKAEHNHLSYIELCYLPALKQAQLGYNFIEEIILKQLPNLTNFYCHNSKILDIVLDAKELPKLSTLYIPRNALMQLHLKDFQQLYSVTLEDNYLNDFQLINTPKITLLHLKNNTQLVPINYKELFPSITHLSY